LNINASVFDQDKLKIDTTTIKNEIKKQGSHSEPNSGRSHYFGKKDKYKEEPPKDQQNTEIQYHPPSNEENVLTIPENLPAVKFNVKKGQQKDTNQQGLYNQNPNQNFDPNQPNGGFNQHWSYPFPNAGNHPNKQTNYNNTFGDNNAYYQQVFNANYLNQYYGNTLQIHFLIFRRPTVLPARRVPSGLPTKTKKQQRSFREYILPIE